jgi:hypothetical protein
MIEEKETAISPRAITTLLRIVESLDVSRTLKRSLWWASQYFELTHRNLLKERVAVLRSVGF